jgi:hypothetical protein
VAKAKKTTRRSGMKAAAESSPDGATKSGAKVRARPGRAASASAAMVAEKTAAKSKLVVPPIEEIEMLVKARADHLTNRDIHLGQNVGSLFPNGKALDRLLIQIQDAIPGAGLLLTSRPTDEKGKLLKGTFVDLADWVFGTLKAGAPA